MNCDFIELFFILLIRFISIAGPATVRMVSTNSSPPIPLPVQVPPGHVVQQVVDEHGTLQHLILSTQPLTMPMYPCVSTISTSI